MGEEGGLQEGFALMDQAVLVLQDGRHRLADQRRLKFVRRTGFICLRSHELLSDDPLFEALAGVE
jgi:hypothetical protein